MTTRPSSTRRFALLATLVSLISPPLALADFQYTLKDLGTLGGTQSIGASVNSLGQVAGYSDTVGGSTKNAFLSAPNGGALKNVGSLGGGISDFAGANSSGQVFGSSYTNGGFASHAFLSAPNGGILKDLGTLGGSDSFAYGANASGQVAGYSYTNIPLSTPGTFASHAFLSAANGGALKDLGTLGGVANNSFSYGNGVNTTGQVTGGSYDSSGALHAFLSAPNGGVLKDLGAGSGNSVNDLGQVTGYSGDHAFLSAPNGGALTNLGVLGAFGSNGHSSGSGVNASGQVVGYSTKSADTTNGPAPAFAFLYRNSTMVDLNTLIDPASGFTLNVAQGISDNGFIVGYGTTATGVQHAFLLTPTAVPEPSAFALTALGIAALAAASRRRA